MCVTSVTGDYWNEYFKKWPCPFPQQPFQPTPLIQPIDPIDSDSIERKSSVLDFFNTRTEVDKLTKEFQDLREELRKEVTHMKELLRRAKLYDEQTNQPDCQMDDKIATLRKVAELVGISLDDIFPKKT